MQRCKSEDIFGSQVSALRSQVRVRGKIQILNLHPHLKTLTWDPTAETRDLKFRIFSYPCPDPYPYP